MPLVTVSVGQADIELGKGCNCETCPVARALARAGAVDPKVYGQTATVYSYPARTRVSVTLPWQVQDFIEEFDSGLSGRPFTFVVELPAQA